MSKSAFIAVALALSLGTACNNAADRATNAANDAAAAATPREDIRMSAPEQEFVQAAIKGNQMEVDLAEIAEGRSQNKAVDEFAEQLERDHSNVLDELRRLADKADIRLTDEPAAEKASMTNQLEAAKGPAFDREYVSMMVDAHKKNIAKFESMQSTATGELKALIDKTLPVMREHLRMAEALVPQVGK
jgi:putative membrane protein